MSNIARSPRQRAAGIFFIDYASVTPVSQSTTGLVSSDVKGLLPHLGKRPNLSEMLTSCSVGLRQFLLLLDNAWNN